MVRITSGELELLHALHELRYLSSDRIHTSLRHTFASHLVMRGVRMKAVQELMGHATMEMTMRYSHLSPDVRRDAVEVLSLPSRGTIGAQEASADKS